MPEKICRLCGDPKDESEFYVFFQRQQNGKKIRTVRTECKECNGKKTRAFAHANPYYYVYQNLRGSDRRAGRQCDLTVEDVKRLLSQRCSYCEASGLKMSIDRKDSTIGHTKENSVPACLQCNSFKSDMPWEAWEHFIPTMKKVRGLGLLEGWNAHSSTRAKKKRESKKLA